MTSYPRWSRELRGSEREPNCIALLLNAAGLSPSERLDADSVERFLTAAMTLTTSEDSEFTSPVARFELLTIADGMAELMLSSLPKKTQKRLDWLAVGIGGGTLIAAVEAIRAHMGYIQYDVFISHAAEDKAALARPLAEELRSRGLKVWFDEYVLKVGDRLRREIDRGLADCDFGVVLLSKNFLRKQWPARELDGLAAREIARGSKLVLPIWHGVDSQTIAGYSPPLADKLGLNSSVGVAELARKIIEAVTRTP